MYKNISIKNIDYLVYSSHKTATQTLLKILENNNLKSFHIHELLNLFLFCGNYKQSDTKQDIKNKLLKEFEEYKMVNKKKLSLISIIRNPHDRLISSFFQSYYSDELMFYKKKPSETTVDIKNTDELYNMYIDKIKNKSLPNFNEALNEMNYLFDDNVIEKLDKNNNYYYYENKYIKMYVIDFKKVISNDNLNYLNSVLNLKLSKNGSSNRSNEKSYYEKYKILKEKISKNTDLNNFIKNNFDKFYFNSFS